MTEAAQAGHVALVETCRMQIGRQLVAIELRVRRERGTVRTSTSLCTLCDLRRRMNSSIVRVEWPIVITNNGIPFTSGLIPPSEYLLCLMNKGTKRFKQPQRYVIDVRAPYSHRTTAPTIQNGGSSFPFSAPLKQLLCDYPSWGLGPSPGACSSPPELSASGATPGAYSQQGTNTLTCTVEGGLPC
jgi:hypothetical protein